MREASSSPCGVRGDLSRFEFRRVGFSVRLDMARPGKGILCGSDDCPPPIESSRQILESRQFLV